jgi:hypothetical protein
VLEESDLDKELERAGVGHSLPPPPGALLLAEKIERRRFLRHGATALFGGFMAVSSGTASIFAFLANPAQASSTGACCPTGCGPSPCCNTTCCTKGCCSPVGKDYTCDDNGITCFGFAGTWGGGSCWSYNSGGFTVICCDCLTNNQTNCPNPNGYNRCICYQASGLSPATLPKGIPLIRDTRDIPAWAQEQADRRQ